MSSLLVSEGLVQGFSFPSDGLGRTRLVLSRFEVWNPFFLIVSSLPCFEEEGEEEEEENEEEEEMVRSSRP